MACLISHVLRHENNSTACVQETYPLPKEDGDTSRVFLTTKHRFPRARPKHDHLEQLSRKETVSTNSKKRLKLECHRWWSPHCLYDRHSTAQCACEDEKHMTTRGGLTVLFFCRTHRLPDPGWWQLYGNNTEKCSSLHTLKHV